MKMLPAPSLSSFATFMASLGSSSVAAFWLRQLSGTSGDFTTKTTVLRWMGSLHLRRCPTHSCAVSALAVKILGTPAGNVKSALRQRMLPGAVGAIRTFIMFSDM